MTAATGCAHQVGALGVCIGCGLAPALWRAPKTPKGLRSKSTARQAARPAELAVIDLVFRRDHRCLLDHLAWHTCWGPWTPHHLAKQSAGGVWTVDNVITLCAGGNGWVEDHPHQAQALGLVVIAGKVTARTARHRRIRNGITW